MFISKVCTHSSDHTTTQSMEWNRVSHHSKRIFLCVDWNTIATGVSRKTSGDGMKEEVGNIMLFMRPAKEWLGVGVQRYWTRVPKMQWVSNHPSIRYDLLRGRTNVVREEWIGNYSLQKGSGKHELESACRQQNLVPAAGPDMIWSYTSSSIIRVAESV